MKICRNCSDKPQPISNFTKNTAKKDGLQTRCKKCMGDSCKETNAKNRERYNAKRREYRSKNREKCLALCRAGNLRRDYGISPLQYDAMFNSQSGCCKICRIDANKLKKPLAVDHDHKTGRVRGLLCYHCNWLIGHAKEQIPILRETIKYLENYQQ